MSVELLLTLAALAFAVTITPGPNNLLVASSGVNFGYRRTLRHILGIVFGFPVLLLVSNTGLTWLVLESQQAIDALKYCGGAYILFLSWKLVKGSKAERPSERLQPLSFSEACLMQWFNPKAWVLSAATASALAGQTVAFWITMLVTVVLFASISFLSASAWCLLGEYLQDYLCTGRSLKLFNLALAQLLAVSAAVLVFL